MARKKPVKAKNGSRPKSALTLINLKVTSKDREILTTLAKKHADGNLSAWLRRAGRSYRPN